MPEPVTLSAELTRKRDRVLELLRGYGRVAVALSAGVDSSVVARAAVEACDGRAVAVTADSPSLAAGELEAAQRLAAQIGLPHKVLKTEEPSGRKAGVKVKSVAELVEKLKTEAGVL